MIFDSTYSSRFSSAWSRSMPSSPSSASGTFLFSEYIGPPFLLYCVLKIMCLNGSRFAAAK